MKLQKTQVINKQQYLGSRLLPIPDFLTEKAEFEPMKIFTFSVYSWFHRGFYHTLERLKMIESTNTDNFEYAYISYNIKNNAGATNKWASSERYEGKETLKMKWGELRIRKEELKSERKKTKKANEIKGKSF